MKSINKQILKLAFPNIISNVSVPLLGLADLAILGHLNNISYLGGVALGTIIFDFLYWNFAFLRMGTSGITAQAYGKKDQIKQTQTLVRSFLIGITAALLLIILQIPIEKLAMFALDGSPEVKAEASEYFKIRIYAAPATIGIYALTGWFIGMQNSIIPMIVALTINISNFLFSFSFVYWFGMKTEGVALGTVLAQYLGIIVSLFFLLIKYKKHFIKEHIFHSINIAELKEFLTVNIDIFIRTFCVIIVMTFFTSTSAGLSNEILAVNAMLLRFFLLFSYFIDGFAFAAEALTGKYVGAGNTEKLKQTIWLIIKWGLFLSISISLVFILADTTLIALLTSDTLVQQQSIEFMWWLKLIPIVAFMAFVWDGIYIGATATKEMRNSLLIAFILFFSFYFAFKPFTGNHSLWLAFYAYLLSRGIYQTFTLKKAIFKTIKVT